MSRGVCPFDNQTKNAYTENRTNAMKRRFMGGLIQRDLRRIDQKLTITNRNAAAPFRLMQLDDMYIPEETVSGNIPLRYTYAGSLFVLRDKLLLSFLLFSVWLLCAASLFAKSETRRNVQVCGLLLLLAFVLTWNGLFCVFDHSVKRADKSSYPAESGFGNWVRRDSGLFGGVGDPCIL